MNGPQVSILIPVFNRENYIAECIQSALNQTFSDFEIVIVDNASDDGTWKICQKFSDLDNRVRIFRNTHNIGPVRNWFRCVEEARGEFGKLLFSDDLIFPQFLEHTLPYLEDKRIAFVATAAIIGESLSNGIVHPAHPGSQQRITVEQFFQSLIEAKVHYSPGAAIFRMKDIRENLLISIPTKTPRDFSTNGAGPDVLLYALTALSYQQVIMLSQPDVFFRVHSDSFTVANNNSQVTNGYRAAISWFSKNKLSEDLWAIYVARLWWADVKTKRRLISLWKYTLNYEGNNNLYEIKSVFLVAIVVILKDFLNSFCNIFKKCGIKNEY
jgi:glycosyltransferase involved in cell wall biosynthesis